MTDFASDGIATVRTPAYNEYFNTDGSKATPLFDGSFGRCFRNQAARHWSGVCISVTLWLVYRHLLYRRPRRSSANTVARHTLPNITLPSFALSKISRKHIGLLLREMIQMTGEKRVPSKSNNGSTIRDRSAVISECDEPKFDLTDLCRIKLRSLTCDSIVPWIEVREGKFPS